MSNDLHERLRRAREKRGLSLEAIARARGVREQALRLIDDDAFEQLPTGLYGRAVIRAYAVAVGLPADEAIAEVAHRLRTPEDPIEGLARVRGIEPKPQRWSIDVAPSVARPFTIGFAWRPRAAALLDLGILVGIDLTLIQLTALTAGVDTAEVVRTSLPLMALLFAVIASVYFVLLGGVRQATIGARLVQAPAYANLLDGTDARTIVQRGAQYALGGVSSLAALPTFSATTDHAREWIRTLREKRA
jgi:transcriptional regulator with XRE-family HTH domain